MNKGNNANSVAEKRFRNMRTSYTNLEFMDSIACKRSYDEVLSELIAIARPIILKQEAIRR